MHILLVDNYDSFTYNLYHLLGVATGVEPTVIRNDETDNFDLREYDSVVISPGPGHPLVPRDLGVSREILDTATIPVLGICLGHEGIICSCGGSVDTAPKPLHGYIDKIRHNGSGLFHGIPQNFSAVRYHSLCAKEPLPRDLQVVARASDNVVMAVAHRTRPLWGLQFHPESVATEYGEELVRNWATLIRKPDNRQHRSVPRQKAPQSQPTDVRRLLVDTVEFAVDTQQAFELMYADSDSSFWLDSEHVEPGLDRFSFLGDASGPLSETVSYSLQTASTTVLRGDVETVVEQDIFEYLEHQLAAKRTEASELPFDFECGYVGYFGYELKALTGSTNRHQAETPDASWIFADRLIAVDHVDNRTYVLALDHDSSQAWIDETVAALNDLPAWSNPDAIERRANPKAASKLLVRDRDQYLDDIRDTFALLRRGETYELCLTNTVEVPSSAGGLDVYRTLRQCNPAPYAAYLRFGDVEIACSSPERFLKLNRSGLVESKPIKGTAARSSDPDEDLERRQSLAADPKTRAENLMIVDLLRNDLGRVCQVGSVHVPKLMATESYATVHQMVSTIRGTLRNEVSAVECIKACFPGGSMTGAPKLRTIDLIDQMETQARGIYSGTIGFLALTGAADLNIVIRTAVRANGKWQIGSGGAIVLDSKPDEEYQEMLLKAMAVLRAFSTHPGLGSFSKRVRRLLARG